MLLKVALVELKNKNSETNCLQRGGDMNLGENKKNRVSQDIIEDYRILKIAIYILYNDREKWKEIQQQVIKQCNNCSKKNIKTIVLGDFNDIINKNLN